MVSTGDNTTTTGFCPLGPVGGDVACRFVFTAPRPLHPGQPLNVNISAKDAGNNWGKAVTTLSLGVAPVVTKVSPVEGSAAGGREIVVEGDNFIAGTQLVVGG